jgi:hypothetical protein
LSNNFCQDEALNRAGDSRILRQPTGTPEAKPKAELDPLTFQTELKKYRSDPEGYLPPQAD